MTESTPADTLRAAAHLLTRAASVAEAHPDLWRHVADGGHLLAAAHAILGQPPEHAEKHAVRPQGGLNPPPATVEPPEGENGPQAGAQRLTPNEIADLLDEFIADAARRGADRAWVLGARCITGRVRLADPGALGGGEANAQEALAELRARLVAQHTGAMDAAAASSGDAALIHDGSRMGLDVAVAELDALALRLDNPTS
jgi:hypothetical protein